LWTAGVVDDDVLILAVDYFVNEDLAIGLKRRELLIEKHVA